jgi:transposase
MVIVRSRETLVSAPTQLVTHVPKERSNPSGFACPSALSGASTSGPKSTSPSLLERIRAYDRKLDAISKEHYPETELLREVEGIGPITALTFVLTLEDPHCFERSRSVGA